MGIDHSMKVGEKHTSSKELIKKGFSPMQTNVPLHIAVVDEKFPIKLELAQVLNHILHFMVPFSRPTLRFRWSTPDRNNNFIVIRCKRNQPIGFHR